MTGLTESEFDCLFECLESFLSALVSLICKSADRGKCRLKTDKKTELMCFLKILRHAVHLCVIGWMADTSFTIQSRIFLPGQSGQCF